MKFYGRNKLKKEHAVCAGSYLHKVIYLKPLTPISQHLVKTYMTTRHIPCSSHEYSNTAAASISKHYCVH